MGTLSNKNSLKCTQTPGPVEKLATFKLTYQSDPLKRENEDAQCNENLTEGGESRKGRDVFKIGGKYIGKDEDQTQRCGNQCDGRGNSKHPHCHLDIQQN